MDKERLMAAITNYCHETKGLLPKNIEAVWFTDLGANVPIEIIQRHAKELGYINGYRYGVEYPTNSEKPDLPDDVIVCIEGDLSASGGDSVDVWNWGKIKSFRITDQRYKPADTSYLSVSEIPESKSNAENASDWYDYEAQKAVALPPVGEKVEFNYQTEKQWEIVFVVAHHHYRGDLIVAPFERSGTLRYATMIDRFRPLDHNRKAEAEKKRVVDAAYNAIAKPNRIGVDAAIAELYDAGFLRMPAN